MGDEEEFGETGSQDRQEDENRGGQPATFGGEVEQPGDVSTYLIGLALVEFEGLFAPTTVTEAVAQSWRTGATTRPLYSRRWTISRVFEDDNGGYSGRIGFVRENDVTTVSFDESTGDFVQTQTASGQVVPFLLTRSGQLAFQLVPGIVRESSFIRAFTELMNGGRDVPYTWRVTPLSVELDYDSWSSSITRLTKFDFRLERPNPHYHDDDVVEKLIEDTRSAYVRLTGVAQADNSIDTSSDPFRQALDHVVRNYGKATLTGEDTNDSETVWTKTKNSAARTLARVRISTAGGSEASLVTLQQAVTAIPANASAVVVDESEDDSTRN